MIGTYFIIIAVIIGLAFLGLGISTFFGKKKKFPDTLLLFVTPPSATVLEERLRGRGTETEEVIQDRLKRASEEAMYMEQYDYILVNDTLETCVEQMHQLIQSQHEKVSENLEFIEKMKTELKQL